MKIRIAVAVAEDGEWTSSGWGSPKNELSDEEKMGFALEGLDADSVARCFIEADIPFPKPTTIKGVVVEGKP